MFSKSRKLISMLIVFVIVFTYMGQTLEAIATSDGISAITNGFFKADEMEFNSYFVENEQQNNENISDVNQKATLVFELSPNNIGQGFLKTGSILANSLNGSDINFKFSKIKNIIIDEPEQVEENSDLQQPTQNDLLEENIVDDEILVDEEIENEEENVIEDKTIDDSMDEVVENDIMTEEDTEENNLIKNETSINLENLMDVTSRSSESRSMDTEELINEEEFIDNLTEESYEELTAKDFEIDITEDNQISVKNIIYHTTIEVEIEYNKTEELHISDLYQEINLQLTGTYININLNKIATENNQVIKVGWSYHQEFDVVGEYTQFSPFRLGEHAGIIVESKINVKRETEDENYLPIKQTTIEVNVPDYNGNAPETVNVQTTKLMATKGEDVGDVTFGEDNWVYDAQNKKIIITVINENNGTAIESIGEDEYILVYRYNDYTEEQTVTMENNFEVTVEEYSANDIISTTKQFTNSQEINTQINNLITYNISSTEEKLNKAKINANYNSEEGIYESTFTTTVDVNILTSDLLEEFKLNSSKDVYLDSNSAEFDATSDIYYSKVKFNYSEIKNLLQNGATIEIQNLSGELLYTLNNDFVQNQDSCEVRLESREKGIYVVFKNIAMNGNVSVEFTKAIRKSNYDKSAFNTFKQIKSYVSAELKYKNYEERYAMEEIATTKELQNSQTVAEISLSNNNLSTLSKNDGVEVRIALNNDKQDTDLYSNPSFELVFPKYVTDVTVENINLIYGCGLEIANFETYTENNLVKMRIELSGTQTTFSESVLTNGTNIVLNLNLTLDEYTPKKQDQIKMYYCNENVTNYESQIKWTISKNVPNGILKDTNGFDVAIVNYQAPNGFITANAIINYDGQASKIKSIAQGEKTAEVGVNKQAQIATMELVAINNTENVCTDVVLMGRIPFAGNQSVVTGIDLNSTATATMLGGIQEKVQSINTATIYYSTNEKATTDLNNSTNGWTTNVINWQNIKSYMIVIKGEMLPGAVLKYTYDFEIPGNLDYDKALYGSFGGFYNNNYESVVSYESSEADKVGLITEINPIKIAKVPNSQIEIDFSSSLKESQKIGQKYNYTATLTNNSELDLQNVKLELYLSEKIDYEYSTVSRVGKYKKQIQAKEDGQSVVYMLGEEQEEEKEIKEDESATYHKESNKVEYILDTFKNGETIDITANVKGIIEGENVTTYVVISSDNLEENIVSDSINANFYDVKLSIDELATNQEQLIERNEVELKYIIRNQDERDINELIIAGSISDNIEDLEIYVCGKATGMGYVYADITENKYKDTIYYLYSGEEVEMTLRGKIKNGTANEMFTALIEVYTDDMKSAGHSYSYGIQANNSPIEEIEEQEEIIENQEIVSTDGIVTTETTTEREEGQYSLSGNIYVESDKDNENILQKTIAPSQVQVQLLKGSNMIKATTTDSLGNYKFEGLEQGDYSVVFNYDENKYTQVQHEEASNMIQIQDGVSVTDTITIVDRSVSNVNSCLQEKENFDLELKQYITKAIVDINGEETEYAYENLDLAKLEIDPSEIENAIVKFEYKLVIENVGNVNGQVTSIVDYVPNGLTFNEAENEGWSKGVTGNVYTDMLKGVEIAPGEKAEITLVLSKTMSEDNTGVVSNKAKIAYTESATRLTETQENNFATQETIVTLTQGGILTNPKVIAIFTISFIGVIGLFGYMVQSGKVEISLNVKKGIKKVYK